jgi:hypothetical protein
MRKTQMRKLEDKTLIVASHNAGKIREIRDLIGPMGFEARSAAELNFVEPDETGTTFEENATIKALASAKASGLPALSDDSGLVVDALNGDPGVYTANWAETPDGTRDFAMAMQKVEPPSRRPELPPSSGAPAASSRCCASPGRMAMSNCSVAKWKAISSGRRAAAKDLVTTRSFNRGLRHHIRRDECRGKAWLEAGRRPGAIAPRAGVQAFSNLFECVKFRRQLFNLNPGRRIKDPLVTGIHSVCDAKTLSRDGHRVAGFL